MITQIYTMSALPAPTTSSSVKPGLNRLRNVTCKTRREPLKFWELVRLILEDLRYAKYSPGANDNNGFRTWYYWIPWIERDIRDRFVKAPSQWEATSHCNVVSRWLGAFTNDPWTCFHPRTVTYGNETRYRRIFRPVYVNLLQNSLPNWVNATYNNSVDKAGIRRARVEAFKTHWGRDKMDVISQTTFSNEFSWMKIFERQLKFHWSLFLRVQLAISQHWFR